MQKRTNAKRRRPGRPKLPKGEAKGRIVPIRFSSDVLKAMQVKADKNNQSISEWIRNVVGTALE